MIIFSLVQFIRPSWPPPLFQLGSKEYFCLISRFKMELRCSDRKSWNIRHFFVPRLGLGIKDLSLKQIHVASLYMGSFNESFLDHSGYRFLQTFLIQNQQNKHQKKVWNPLTIKTSVRINDVVLVSSFLMMNIFHTFL